MKKIKSILPGFIICFLVMLLSKKLIILFPTIGAGPLAIFLGIFFGNTFFKNDIYNEGYKYSESNLLSYSIVLLGTTLTFDKLSIIGTKGFLFIFFQLTFTIFFSILIGKKLGFSKNFSKLMASGNAICGSSAIGAVAPVIEAKSEDKAMSITIVNLTGTILLFLIPILGKNLLHFDDFLTSAMIGGILQSVGQVIASGAMVNDYVLELATIFKIVRILFLVLVVYIFSGSGQKVEGRRGVKNNKASIPWYIVCFFIMSVLTSIHFIPNNFGILAKKISSQLELIALVAIGMRVKIDILIKQGPKASLYGLFIAFIQVILAIFLLKIFF